jgi:hypothetical protein
VIRRRDLPKWFRRLPSPLSAEAVAELKRVAGRPATWRPRAVAAEELVLKSWSRYGKKRTYVDTPEGKNLGYRDELTGEVFAETANALKRVKGALEEHSS